jgi:hypothetical protein
MASSVMFLSHWQKKSNKWKKNLKSGNGNVNYCSSEEKERTVYYEKNDEVEKLKHKMGMKRRHSTVYYCIYSSERENPF